MATHPPNTALTSLPADDRREEIVRRLGQQTSPARVEDLAELFAVSRMTIHRDLGALAEEGRIQRVRGGARQVPKRLTERDVKLRRNVQAAQKRALGEVAVAMVAEGDIIALDDSSTVAAMFELLPPRMELTIITHSLGLMHEVARHRPDVTLVGVGGEYYPETDSFLGATGLGELSAIRANTSFVSTTAVRGGVLYHPDSEAAVIKRAFIEMADRKVLLADATKFEANGLYQVAPLSAFDDIVVDADLPSRHVDQLDGSGARVHRAPVP